MGGGGGGFRMFIGKCYLCVREGVTQARGADGREANSPPLLLQRPGQLFKLHLLLPDRLQQSCCALTLLHTHCTAQGGRWWTTHTHTPCSDYSEGGGGGGTDATLHTKYSNNPVAAGADIKWEESFHPVCFVP